MVLPWRCFIKSATVSRCGHWVQVPRVGAHLRREGVHATMFCSHWFITLFAYTLPFDHLLRVWDVLFLEGPKIIFRRETARSFLSKLHGPVMRMIGSCLTSPILTKRS